MRRLKKIKIQGRTPLQRLQNYIDDRNGEVVGYLPAFIEEKVTVRCHKGHVWTTRGSKLVSEQSWCKECGRDRQRLGIDRAREIARERGGECLSSEYRNVHTPMEWRCKKWHEFRQTVNEITQKGQWCPECRVSLPLFSKTLRTFDGLKEELAAAGIHHIGTARALHKPTTWRCQCGYEFNASGQNMIKRKPENWCKACAGIAPPTIETVQREAERRGGRCLSTEYVNNREPMEFECAEGHRWWAKWSNIGSNGTWCPDCR